MYCHFRKRHSATHHWKPTPNSLLNHSSDNDELVSNVIPIANDEDIMYLEYRDELSDFVTVKN